MPKRKAISKKTRFEVFKRDGFACQYCGDVPPKVILHVDHITPVASGGSNVIDNLVTSCSSCNLGKGARELSDIPQSLKDKAASIKEKEAQIAGYNDVLMAKNERITNDAWDVVETLEGEEIETYNKKRIASIKVFLNRMPTAEVIEAAEITNYKFSSISGSAFRYFCGICWSKVKGEDNA